LIIFDRAKEANIFDRAKEANVATFSRSIWRSQKANVVKKIKEQAYIRLHEGAVTVRIARHIWISFHLQIYEMGQVFRTSFYKCEGLFSNFRIHHLPKASAMKKMEY